jgi:hypothetical protein
MMAEPTTFPFTHTHKKTERKPTKKVYLICILFVIKTSGRGEKSKKKKMLAAMTKNSHNFLLYSSIFRVEVYTVGGNHKLQSNLHNM